MISLSQFCSNNQLYYTKKIESKFKRLGLPLQMVGRTPMISEETAEYILEQLSSYVSLEEISMDECSSFMAMQERTLELIKICEEHRISIKSIDELPFVHPYAKHYIQTKDKESLWNIIHPPVSPVIETAPEKETSTPCDTIPDAPPSSVESIPLLKEELTPNDAPSPPLNPNIELQKQMKDPFKVKAKQKTIEKKPSVLKKEQIAVLLEPIRHLRETHRCFLAYATKHYVSRCCIDATKDFVSYLLSVDKEFHEYSTVEESALFEWLNSRQSDIVTYLLSFIKEYRSAHKMSSKVTFVTKINKNAITDPTIAFDKYISMAFFLFNPGHIEKYQMMEKALDSRALACQYLYMAMHFTCGWRSYDIITMPRPCLFDTPDSIRQKIRAGTFSAEDAELYVSYVETYIANSYRKPHKTERFDAPKLQLYVFESYRQVIGTLLAICTLHYTESAKSDEPFLNISGMNVLSIEKLIGPDYIICCGRKNFISLSYNKRTLQLLQEMAETENKGEKTLDAYMLASLVRSHVGNYRTFATSTSHYLKAKMDGLNVNEVLTHLYERGVCSFVPYKILSGLEPEEFDKLDVTQQTAAIKLISQDPYSLEKLCETNELMQIHMQQQLSLISSIIEKDPATAKERITELISNIATSKSAGKEPFCYCLKLAAGHACPHPERDSCIGCGYEMYLKSMLFTIGSKMHQIAEAEQNAVLPTTKHKYQTYNSKILLPIAQGLLQNIKLTYGQDITNYKKVLQNALKQEDSYHEIFITEN